MVMIDFRRDRIVFRFRGEKYEWIIEPRYWRNPMIAVLMLMCLPVVLFRYPNLLTMITTANIYAAIAVMLALQTIGTGRINFGPQLYVGIGGLAASVFNIHFNMGPLLTLIITIILSLLVAFSVSPIVLIARGLYFALLTLILPLVLLELTFIYTDVFGGEFGLSGMTPLIDLGRASWNYLTFCYLSMVLMLLYTLIVDKILKSRFGAALAAINDDEDAAEAMGVPTRKYKLFSYIFPSICMGITGWFIAHTFRTFAGITYLNLDFMIKILLIIIIGGRATIYGPIVGAYFIAFIEELLRMLGPIHNVIFPVTLILLAFILREGLWGLYHKRRYRDYYPKIRVRR